MEIIGTNLDEEQKKDKKLMKIITVIIVILLLVSVALGGLIYYLKIKQFKFIVNGKTITNYSSDLFEFQNEKMYVSLKDIASIVGYEYKNGGYKQYTEDTDKCYLECVNEVVTLERDSNKIYKTAPDDLDYTYYNIKETVKRINGKLYVNAEDLGIICNLQINYYNDKNRVNINTLPYIVNYYTVNYTNSSLSNFNNQKALLYGLMIVQSVDNTEKNQYNEDIRFGVNNLKNEEIVGLKYTNIEFIEGSQEFIVTTPEKKVGLITKDGDTRVSPQYDALKQIDKDRNLYLATNNKKSGVIERNGKILIYLEYDQIGVNKTQFPSNDIKNKYILFNNAIPVMRDKKWGLFDIDGKEILPVDYDSMGCVVRTSSDRSLNNILVIPEIEGIVIGKEFPTENNNKTMYYGVVSSTGQILIPTGLDTIYSVITSGQETYTMVYLGNSMDLIEYIEENGILERENSQTVEEDVDEQTNNNQTTNTNQEVYTNQEINTNQVI